MPRLLPMILVLLMIASTVGPVSADEDSNDMRKKRNFSDALKVGDEAPLFTLKALHGEEIFELEASRSAKPVVLFFGSYT
jgi:hypothetical protein